MRFTSILLCALLPVTLFAKDWAEKVIDIPANANPEDYYTGTKVSALNKEKQAYVGRVAVTFATKGKWTGGDKDVGVTSVGALNGVDDATFQAITDEYEAYLNTKMGELFTVLPYESFAACGKFAKIGIHIPAADLGKEVEVAKFNDWAVANATHVKTFAPGGRPLQENMVGHPKTMFAIFGCNSELKATMVDAEYHLGFAIASSEMEHYHNSKTATLKLNPILFTPYGRIQFTTSGSKLANLGIKVWAAAPDKSWIKDFSKVDGVWVITADPMLFKVAALNVLKAHADLVVAAIKKERE